MAASARRRPEPTYTTAEAAVILTLAADRAGTRVSKRIVDGAIDKRLFPAAVVRGRGGRRTLTATGLRLVAAELALRRELPVVEARRRVHQQLVASGVRQGYVQASPAVVVDVAAPLARVEEALERYRRLMDEIEIDPDVQRGEPVLRGTRITAYTIAEIAERGTPEDEIFRHYPGLRAGQVEAARLFAKAHPRRGRPAPAPEGRVVLALTDEELRSL